MGALLAAEFIHARGFQDITMEGDAMNVVHAIRGGDMTGSPYGQVVEDTREVLQSLRSWTVNHVKREANQAAHGLAKPPVMNENWNGLMRYPNVFRIL